MSLERKFKLSLPSSARQSSLWRKAPQGFSLIELLLASLVMAVGVLSMISLQVKSVGVVNNSNLRASAVVLVSDMAQRMRNNRNIALANGYLTNGGSNGADLPACISLAGCSGAELAQQDIWEWHQRIIGADTISQGLPSGNGRVFRNTDDGSFSVEVSWVKGAGPTTDQATQRQNVTQRVYL
jgi:type IV pilus assembly protein PilV